jgi:hypothetical protein
MYRLLLHPVIRHPEAGRSVPDRETALTHIAGYFLSVPVFLLAIPEDLSRSFVFPVSPLLYRPIE